MGRSDVRYDGQKKYISSRMYLAHETDFLNLPTLFSDTGTTVPMSPKTIAAVRAGDEIYVRDMTIDVELALSSVNDHGNTMLHLAAAAGHTSLVCYILYAYPGLLMKSNLMGEVALHVAAGAGHLDVVEALVASCLVSAEQCLSFVPNKDGFSPLYLAIEAGQADLAKHMWKHSNNGSSSTYCLASKVGGRSIVHGAMKAKRKDLIAAILNEDASLINLRYEGRTCLSFGASIGYYEGVYYLLDKSIDSVYVSDDDGSFPIHMAAKYGHVKILKAILKRCPDALELLDIDGQNILHVAAKNGKAEVIKFILRCYKDKNKEKLINEEDVNGNTPLHLATKNWHPKVVSMLTWDNRVDLETLNHNGLTAIDVAEGNMDSSYTFFQFPSVTQQQNKQQAAASNEQDLLMCVYKFDLFGILQRLTWMALISAGAPSGPNPIISTPVTDNPDGGKHKDRINTLLLVATLVATMTFTAGFTLPGGYNGSAPNLGMATLAKKTAFQVFLLFDTLAMYCSIVAVVALIWAHLGDISLIMKAFNLALPLLGFALISMSIAFMAGTHASISHLPFLAYFILGIGLFFLLALLLIIIPYVSPHYTTKLFLRHMFYCPYFLMLLAAGDNRNND
ncbi:hypothetical protein Bca101_003220 [Brassica carinata]